MLSAKSKEQLIPVLPRDAHCGSVEFMMLHGSSTMVRADGDDDTTIDREEEEEEEPPPSSLSPMRRRLYFDLNLLSTLPVDPSALLEKSPDPWLQLASAIWVAAIASEKRK